MAHRLTNYDAFSIEQFAERCESGSIIPYDGYGEFEDGSPLPYSLDGEHFDSEAIRTSKHTEVHWCNR